jgi:2-C-methyl-D-erythritol 4-phosphate cytidylyltransferase
MALFSVIITAGGIGKRMETTIPKQFLEINRLPILMHTIHCFYSFDSNCQIIVTLPEEWKSYWNELIDKYSFKIPHLIIDGGKERYDSIKNALDFCENTIIAVHDGVRPLVSHETIIRCLKLSEEKGTAIPTMPLKDSLRKFTKNGTQSVERKEYLAVQTPQFFQADILKSAYQIHFHEGITDDASLVEEAGFKIEITQGNEENIKLTTPMDLKYINLFIK